ncbi:MAG: hypothetical protein A2X85_17350 [Geobacteraceae bacterium GWF2_54_21]|nr:MAG: hypothetical protein A2X85_17350 [Geobacteraceae bacterium GWF2_54_21]
MLVFSYGSNLRLTWAGLTPVGPAWLPDHALRFGRQRDDERGALDAASAIGSVCAGWLFEVDDLALSKLDIKEGVEVNAYVREYRVLLDADGMEVHAEVYRVVDPVPFAAPDARYLSRVLKGVTRFQMELNGLLDAFANRTPEVLPVFVYGTLKKGRSNHRTVRRHRVLRRYGWVRGSLKDCGDFPALVNGSQKITGELLMPGDPEPFFSDIDRLEGFLGFGESGSFFRRSLVRVEPDGVLAWTYRPMFDTSTYPQVIAECW